MTKKEIEKMLHALSVDELKGIVKSLDDKDVQKKGLDAREIKLLVWKISSVISRQESTDQFLKDELIYSNQRSQKRISAQRAFEEYITHVYEPNISKANLYGTSKNLFTFTNFSSIYQLQEPLHISNFILDKQKKGRWWQHRSAEATEEALEGYMQKAADMFGDKKDATESYEITFLEEKVALETGNRIHYFSNREYYALQKFLGENQRTLLANEFPILYSESEKGKAYVMGLRTK